MITRTEADAAAATWARAEALRHRAEFEASVVEFDLGFVVTTVAVRPGPGSASGGRRVIDRATGRVSTWPAWPVGTVQSAYREKRAAVVGPPKSWDAELQLRRETWRKVSPGVAAHVTLDGVVHIARGAKGDQRIGHHPLVRQRLAEQTPGETVRGCERHAELLVCSDVLFAVDRQRAADGRAPLTLGEAREMFMAAHFETFMIREAGDPAGGQPNDPCESCTYALTQLALMPWAATGTLHEVSAPRQPSPDPVRFSDAVWSELLKGGHWPGSVPAMNADMYRLTADRVIAVPGLEHRHEAFPALFEAMSHTSALTIYHKAPGEAQRARRFAIMANEAAHSADVLADFGRVIGARLFPIGTVGGDGFLALDEHGRVFALDQAGEWFIAETYLQALHTLVHGTRTHRVTDEGTWGDAGA